MSFPSRKSYVMRIVIWGLVIIPLIALAALIIYAGFTQMPSSGSKNLSLSVSIVVAIAVIAFAVMVMWTWFNTSYTFFEDSLKIKFGPFTKVIPFDEIKQAGKSNAFYSGPALSMKRIEITYGNMGFTVISPINRDEFLVLLKEKCPNAIINIY